MCTPGWVKEVRVPDSDVVLFPQKHLLTFLHDFCVSPLTKRETTSSCSKEKDTLHCRGAVGTSTRGVALHPCCRLHGQKKSLLQQCHRLIDRGSDRGEATICSWICGTGTARIRCTRSTHNVQQLREPTASDVVVSAQQSQSNCLFVTEISTIHTPGSHMSCESSKARLSGQPSSSSSNSAPTTARRRRDPVPTNGKSSM